MLEHEAMSEKFHEIYENSETVELGKERFTK